MKAALLLVIVAGTLTGCFAWKPPHNAGFAAPHTLRELDGTYRNLGEFNPKKTPQADRLSKIIWPGLDETQHQTIRTIAVRAKGDSALSVVASDSSGVVKEQTFKRGKDFEFKDGRLLLSSRWENSLNTPEAGGLFVAYTTREIGVDRKGQGKYKQQATVAGAAYLVAPIAVSESEEVRFVRIEGK